MENATGDALGLVETFGLVAGIEACDAMLKAANVRLLDMEQTVPALITIKIAGETAAVRAACDAGAAAAERVGRVVSVHVIPRPAPEVQAMLMGEGGSRSPVGPSGDIDDMTVRELRDLARQQKDFPLKGREISRATKEQLVEMLRS